MQFAGIRARQRRAAPPAVAAHTLLSMYKGAARYEVTIGDFEVWALNRLRVLKGIETVRSRGLKPAEAADRIQKLIDRFMPDPHVARTADEERLTHEEWKRRDEVSHHILRLAYCQTQDKRRWFVMHEQALFRHRFYKEQSSPAQIEVFMRENGLTYTPIEEAERDEIINDLQCVAEATATSLEARRAAANIQLVQFFKVPFQSCLDLVSSRQVLLRAGYAYVPRDKLVSIIMGRFRTHLNFCMVRAYKALPAILQDPRFAPRLTNLSKAYVGPGFGGQTGEKANGVTPENLNSLIKRGSAPLCMRHLHEKLVENHHLRHGGRMQYGLFLKGIGLSLEDALRFWQTEFTKAMSAEDFMKRFAYNIRHNYGKEGRRKDYSPYNCTRIIMGNPPGSGDFHGCPFRHWQPHHLEAALGKLQISGTHIGGIMDSVSNKHYQIACRRMFEATHPGGDSNDVGNHPNAYFAASQAYYKDKAGAGADATAATTGAGTGAGAGASASASASFVAPTSPADNNKRAATAPAEVGGGAVPVTKKPRTAAPAGEDSQPVAPAGSPGAAQ